MTKGMKISCEARTITSKKTGLLCFFVLEKSNYPAELEKIDNKLKTALKRALKEFEGKIGKFSVVNTLDQLPSQRILLVGLGKEGKINNDTFRIVSGKIALKARDIGVEEFSIVFPNKFSKNKELILSQIIEGVKLSMYKFDNYKKEKSKRVPDLSIIIKEPENSRKIIKISETTADAVNFTKDVANLPPNDCAPADLSKIAKKIASKNRMKCKVFSKSELKKNGFGGISAVGQGSKNEPKLIILEHNKGPRNQKPIIIVGKAVTFDTGGISLKPGEKMEEMKFDKCGGCNVLGIMKAVSELNLSKNVIGIIPSVENMPGGESYRPGDIIKLYSGKTAEIQNTDAEGRLILADAIAYGEKKYSPSVIIDFATLTGACIVALGTNVAGIVSNDEKLVKLIKGSSEKTAEEVWQLPINDDYMDMIKSNVADMKNIGIGRAAGTITAAAFLKQSIKQTPWIHFDIAGVAWTQPSTKEKSYKQKGATGFGVRLVLDYLINN